MKALREIIEKKWYHGSPSGEFHSGTTGIHLGTHEAARQALTARIGHPVEGTWDGTREYGKTLLAGQKTLREKGPYNITGHNCGAPEHDYYAHEHPEVPKFGSTREEMKMSHKPSIKAYRLVGPMSPKLHDDYKANGYMKASLKRGKGHAKKGFYYKNIGEDSGSTSIVVPDEKHLQEV